MKETRKMILDERLKRGWSQRKLAKESGVCQTTIVYAERGGRETSGLSLAKINNAFRKNPVKD